MSPWSSVRVAVALTVLSACAPSIPGKGTGTPVVSDSGEPAASCDIELSNTQPYEGQRDFYWRDAFVFEFSDVDSTATVQFEAPGTATWDDTGTVLTFQPDAPLSPNTDYTVGVDFCRSNPELTFHTSDFGTPIADPSALMGQTYAVALNEGRFIEGTGIAEPLSIFFNRSVYFQVLGVSASGLDLRVAVSGAPTDPLGQDPCFATTDLTGLDASAAPFFQFDVGDFVLGAWEGSLGLLGFQLEGTIAPDGSVVGGVGYSVTVPVSQLGALFDITDVAETCALIEEQGVECQTCPDFSDSACVIISADQLEATLVDIELEAVASVPGDCAE